ncbi:TPA: sugar transferase, partial [Streptococcus pneumoniae]
MNGKVVNSSLAIIHSFLVILLTYLLSAVREAEIASATAIALYILHYFVFYISDYGQDFFKRGYLIELVQTLKYILFFALAISISNFFLEDRFSISRRGMIYFLTLHALLVYVLNLFIKWYWKRAYPNFKGSKKILLLTATSRVEKVLDRLIESNEVVGELVAVSVLDKPDFQHDCLKVVAEGEIVNFATHEVVDEVFINLPSEKYNIGELVSQFETMGIDVTVNLNAFDRSLARNKQIREMAGLNVVIFSTTFYKTSHVIAKRIIDIVGALVGLILCGLVSVVLVPLIRKDGGSAIFAQTRIGKNGRHFTFYKFRSMCVDAEDKKRELMEQNTMQGGMFKVDDDPRITKVGRFIRKTSLD